MGDIQTVRIFCTFSFPSAIEKPLSAIIIIYKINNPKRGDEMRMYYKDHWLVMSCGQ